MIGYFSLLDKQEDILATVDSNEVMIERVAQEPFSSQEFISHCQAAAAINLRLLIVDLDITDPHGLIKGLRLIRASRDHTRIVLLAPGRQPGDRTIHALLSLGVWDIVAPELTDPDDEEEQEGLELETGDSSLSVLLKKQLEMDCAYGNAARWDIQLDDENGAATKADRKQTKETKQTRLDPDMQDLYLEIPQQRESIMIQETIVGTVIIAVCGIESKSGTTHTALLIANFLMRQGYHVAIIEGNDSSDFKQVEDAYEGLDGVDSGRSSFTIKGVTYYRSVKKMDIPHLRDQSYDYIVLDLGNYRDSLYVDEFLRAQVQIVTGHGSEWRIPHLKRFKDHFTTRDQSKWIYAIPNSDEQMIKDIQKIVSGRVVSIPMHPDPWVANQETDQTMHEMLNEYLGGRRKKSRYALHYVIIGVLTFMVVALVIYILSK